LKVPRVGLLNGLKGVAVQRDDLDIKIGALMLTTNPSLQSITVARRSVKFFCMPLKCATVVLDQETGHVFTLLNLSSYRTFRVNLLFLP